METEKRADFLLSFFSTISYKFFIRTDETNLYDWVYIQSDIGWISGVKIAIVSCLDTILDTAFEICNRRLDIVHIIDCYVAIFIQVAVDNLYRSGCIIWIDSEHMRIGVDLVWSPNHQNPLYIGRVVDF